VKFNDGCEQKNRQKKKYGRGELEQSRKVQKTREKFRFGKRAKRGCERGQMRGTNREEKITKSSSSNGHRASYLRDKRRWDPQERAMGKSRRKKKQILGGGGGLIMIVSKKTKTIR